MCFQVDDIKQTYKSERENVDENFPKIFEKAVEMASKVDVKEAKPRVAARQKGKSNNPSATPEEYFKRNIAIPFLDHILENLQEKFDGNTYNYGMKIHA